MGRKPLPDESHELRCTCGSLLARHTERGIEIKCRRCRRIVVVLPEPKRTTPRGPPG